jgi:hypothetical protein
MRMIFILSAALLLPLTSAAAPTTQQSTIEECGALSQAGLRECMTRKAADSQSLLKRAESDAAAALARWDEDAKYAQLAKEKLASSSRAFERYRETQCAFAYSLGGGAIGNALEMRRLACTIDLNQERAASLAKGIADLPRR